MNLTREQAVRVWSEYGLWEFPRKVDLFQRFCPAPSYFFPWLDSVMGRMPAFVSHNAGYARPKGGLQLHVTKTFADIDTDMGASQSEVWEDVCHLSEFLVRERIRHGWVYSGNELAAFHCYVFPEPFWEPPGECRNHATVSRLYQGFWRGLTHELRLRSISTQCLDPPRLIRLPFSRYVQKVGKNGATEFRVGKTWCVPVPWDWIGKYDLKAIQTLSRHPMLFDHYIFEATPKRLEEMISAHHWERFGPEKSALHPMPTQKFVGATKDLFDLYEPNRLCLKELLFETNPPHTIRFAACAQMCKIGLDKEEALDFFDRVAAEAQWVDRANVDIRRGQVSHIWEKQYSVPSCYTLRQRGACLGSACPLFSRYFPNEVPATMLATQKVDVDAEVIGEEWTPE